MDPLTHTATGLFLSRAGLNRITPSATLILLIAANLPDVDVVSALGGALSYFHWHRHLTHSLLAAPLLAVALAKLFRLWIPGLLVFRAAAVALCGICSHLLLDLTNIYGVRVLVPFQETWFHWDLTPVIDFWIWTFLGIAIAGPFLARLVSSEIGDRRASQGGRGFAIAALLFLVCYNGGRALIRQRVLRTIESRVYDGEAPLRTAAFPASANPLHWRGMAETSSAYHLFDLRVPLAFAPSSESTILKVAPSPALDEANKTEAFRIFIAFALYPWYRVEAPDAAGGLQKIQLSDLRFDFTSTAVLDRQGKVQSSVFRFGPAAPR